jgi:hypothetical protein
MSPSGLWEVIWKANTMVQESKGLKKLKVKHTAGSKAVANAKLAFFSLSLMPLIS